MLSRSVDSGTLKMRQAALIDSEGFSTSHSRAFDIIVGTDPIVYGRDKQRAFAEANGVRSRRSPPLCIVSLAIAFSRAVDVIKHQTIKQKSA